MIRIAVIAAAFAAALPAAAQESGPGDREREDLRERLRKAEEEVAQLRRMAETLRFAVERCRGRCHETVSELSRRSVSPDLRPVPLIQAKVTAVDNGIGLVIVSAGRDDGMLEGTEFKIRRAGEEVATVAIDKVDRKWSAARVTLKKSDVRIGDDASNNVVSKPSDPVAEILAVRKELDDVRRQIREVSDQLLPSWKESGFVAEPVSDELKAHLGVASGLVIRRVRPDSPAERAGLRVHDVAAGLDEAGLAEALKTGGTLPVVRGGKAISLTGPK